MIFFDGNLWSQRHTLVEQSGAIPGSTVSKMEGVGFPAKEYDVPRPTRRVCVWSKERDSLIWDCFPHRWERNLPLFADSLFTFDNLPYGFDQRPPPGDERLDARVLFRLGRIEELGEPVHAQPPD